MYFLLFRISYAAEHECAYGILGVVVVMHATTVDCNGRSKSYVTYRSHICVIIYFLFFFPNPRLFVLRNIYPLKMTFEHSYFKNAYTLMYYAKCS
jgi:hypothetical protein